MSVVRPRVPLDSDDRVVAVSSRSNFIVSGRRIVRAVLTLACLLSFCLSGSFSAVSAAQTETEKAVQVVSSEGTLNRVSGGYAILVEGKVENTLPIAVTDVEIIVLFPADPSEDSATTALERIEANSTAKFVATKSVKSQLSKYVAQVSDYRLATVEVATLFSYLWGAEDDLVLREAAASTIVALPPEALQPAIEYFERSPASLDQSSAQTDLIEDLLLVTFLSTTKDASAAQALLQMAVRYSQDTYQGVFAKLVSYAQESKTIIPVLNSAAEGKRSLLQVLTEALASIGEPAIPVLIDGLQSEEPIQSQLAAAALRQMKRETPAEQLAVQDADVRLAVINALTKHYRPEVIVPLLQAASEGETETQLVVDALQSWQMQPVPQLLEALALPDSNAVARDLAERILISLGPSLLPTLTETLTTYQPANPAPITVEDAIARLTQYHGVQRAARRAELYGEGQTRLGAGDCLGAVQYFDEVLSLQPSPNGALLSMAEAYDCAGNKAKAIQLIRQHVESNSGDAAAGTKLANLLLAEADQLSSTVGPDAAISMLTDAVTWCPAITLRERLAQLWTDQGVAQRKQQQWQLALTSFRQARIALPGFRAAIIEAGKTIVRKEWLYVVVSLAAAFWASIKIYLAQRSMGAKGL